MDSPLINYNDAVLYRKDHMFFKDGMWLNDQCINLCFRWLEYSKFKELTTVLFMDPAVVSFMKLQCEDESEYSALSRDLKLESRDILLLPINDNNSFMSSSNHWSLLMVIRSSGILIHFDSSGTYNQQAALSTAASIYTLLGRSEQPTVLNAKTPQQSNGYDCGMYAILCAYYLADFIQAQQCSSVIDIGAAEDHISKFVNARTITDFRVFMFDFITNLFQE
eukprot:gene2027-3943_t